MTPAANPAVASEVRWSELREIVGVAQLRQAPPEAEICGVRPSMIAEPTNEQQLVAALRWADEAGIAVIPIGGGTKLGWGNRPARADLVLSTARLNRVIEHAWSDLTVSAEAGVTIAQLQALLAQHGQHLGIDPLWPETATIGGILSTNDSGTLRLRCGALRDLVIGVTIALPDGTLANSGGKVVKNVAGYDLPKLITGALGTLGVITRAVFRLHPRPQRTLALTFAAEKIETANQFILAAQDSKMAHSGLQLRVASESKPEVDIRFEGTEAGMRAQAACARKLAGSMQEIQPIAPPWGALQDLWPKEEPALVAKISVLPTDIAQTCRTIQEAAQRHAAGWRAVIQATGLGWLRLDAASDPLAAIARGLRQPIDNLVVLQRPAALYGIDVWGAPGDAFDLILAVKRQFDPNGTLNPGRFVGGI